MIRAAASALVLSLLVSCLALAQTRIGFGRWSEAATQQVRSPVGR